jgi:hypothetical protein
MSYKDYKYFTILAYILFTKDAIIRQLIMPYSSLLDILVIMHYRIKHVKIE